MLRSCVMCTIRKRDRRQNHHGQDRHAPGLAEAGRQLEAAGSAGIQTGLIACFIVMAVLDTAIYAPGGAAVMDHRAEPGDDDLSVVPDEGAQARITSSNLALAPGPRA